MLSCSFLPSWGGISGQCLLGASPLALLTALREGNWIKTGNLGGSSVLQFAGGGLLDHFRLFAEQIYPIATDSNRFQSSWSLRERTVLGPCSAEMVGAFRHLTAF